MEKIKNEINKIKVDSIYGKKRHFNASHRKTVINSVIGYLIITISVFEGSYLCYVINEKFEGFWSVFMPILAFLVALLAAIQKYANLEKIVEGHNEVANEYLEISKKAKLLLAVMEDNKIDEEKIIEKIESLQKEYSEINKKAAKYVTSKGDLKKAQEGYKNGEESYTDNELKN